MKKIISLILLVSFVLAMTSCAAPEEIVPETSNDITIERQGDVLFVEGQWLLRIMRSVNFGDDESLQYFQRVLRISGVIDKLIAAGVKDGDTVCIYDFEFDFVL